MMPLRWLFSPVAWHPISLADMMTGVASPPEEHWQIWARLFEKLLTDNIDDFLKRQLCNSTVRNAQRTPHERGAGGTFR